MSQPHYTPQTAHCGFCLPAEQDDDALLVRGTTQGPRHKTAAPQTEEVTHAAHYLFSFLATLVHMNTFPCKEEIRFHLVFPERL